MNPSWAAEWLQRFSGTDPSSLIEMYADDVHFEDVALNRQVDGKVALREFFGDFMNPAARANTFILVGYSGDTNGGAVEWIWKAVHRQPFLGIPGLGKETTVKGVSVVTFQGGNVFACHDYWDVRTVVQQLEAR